MNTANQSIVIVGQEPVGRNTQGPALMGADIEVGFDEALVSSHNQINRAHLGLRLTCADPKLTVLSLTDLVTLAEEPIRRLGVYSHMNHNARDRFYRSFYSRFQSPFEPKPLSPLARVGLALATIGLLAVSFMLGLVFLAVAVGFVLLAAIAVFVRRLLGHRTPPADEDIEVSYRVIDRRRDDP